MQKFLKWFQDKYQITSKQTSKSKGDDRRSRSDDVEKSIADLMTVLGEGDTQLLHKSVKATDHLP